MFGRTLVFGLDIGSAVFFTRTDVEFSDNSDRKPLLRAIPCIDGERDVAVGN